MFDEFFADVKRPPQTFIKNHTDASIIMKKSPFASGKMDYEGNESDEELEDSPSKDGKIDFEKLFERSN